MNATKEEQTLMSPLMGGFDLIRTFREGSPVTCIRHNWVNDINNNSNGNS